MKRCMLLAVLMGVFVGGSVCFYRGYQRMIKNNDKLYQEFKEKELVGVDGKINLAGAREEHDDLAYEVSQLFQQDGFDEAIYLNQIEEMKNNNTNLVQTMSELNEKIVQLEEQKKELNNQYNVLSNKYYNLRKAIEAKKSNVDNSSGFPLINQYPSYPTGCESVALTMLLRYYGVNVWPNNVIDRLKKDNLPYYENGIRYGGNPELGFIGNPYSNASYGVYEKPIAEVANYYKSGIQVRNNFSFQEVLNLVSNNHPVMVWTSMGLSVPYISESWVYKATGEAIYWKAGEHAVVIVGVNDNMVTIADPIGGKLKSYSKSLFEQRYNYFGRKALFYL